MRIDLAPITAADREPVMDIFNHYIENGFAAYPEQRLPYEFFDTLLSMCQGYPSAVARDEAGCIVGFGMLRPYSPIPTFAQTAEIAYFLMPEATGKGIGKSILEHLVLEGKEKGLTSILASISSLNEGSVRFHLGNGFSEFGRFKGVGRKKGRTFDVVYCQRML